MPRHFRVWDGAYPHFVTSTIVHWIPVFCRQDYFQVLVDSLNYCTEHKGLAVHGYVLMPNHFHLICSQAAGHLPEVMRDMKRHTSTCIAEMLHRDGRNRWLAACRKAGNGNVKIWESDYHPEQVHSRAFFEQKLAYVHNNPIRAGYVTLPEEWRYSSAGFYYRDSKPDVPITLLDW